MKRDKPYASSTDVARLAGVSQSAVSRTFKPGASVSPETRKKSWLQRKNWVIAQASSRASC